MSVVKYNYVYKDGALQSAPLPSFYVADTFAELPVGTEGDTAYAKDNDKFYKYVTSWVEIGGSAALPGNIAYTDVANIFTAPQTFTAQTQTLQSATPVLKLTDTAQPVDKKIFRIYNGGQNLVFDLTSDAGVAQLAALILSRTGELTSAGNHIISKVRPELQLSVSGGLAKAHFASVLGGGRIDLGCNIYYDGTQWMRDDVAGAGSLVAIDPSGAIGVYKVAAGANPASIIPVLSLTAAGKLTHTSDLDTAGNNITHGSLRQGLDPANGTGLYTWFAEGSNHLRAAAGLYDYARGNPIGVWITWTPTVVNDAGTGLTHGTKVCKYMLIGKTLFWQIYCDNITNSVDSLYIRFTAPIAILDGYTAHTMTRVYWNFQGHQIGYAYPTSANGTINFARTADGFTGTWLGGTVTHIYQSEGYYQIA